MKCKCLLPLVTMAFTTVIPDKSICVTSHSAEAKVAVGGERHSHCGSPLQMYLPISFRGCSIYVHLELLQKNPLSAMSTPVLLSLPLFNVALLRKEGLILYST